MQANRFPASQGWVWLRTGLALWRRAPLPLTASAMTMVMCLLVSAVLPFIGEIALNLLLPVFSVGLFCCCHAVAQQRPVRPSLLFAGFLERLPRLVGLGLTTLLCGLACTTLAGYLIGPDTAPNAAALSSQEPQDLALYLKQALPAAGLSMLLYSPVALAAWFAAPLIALRRVPLAKALFFSLVACLRNFTALLTFMLLYCILGGLIPGLLVNLLGAIAPQFASFLLAPAIMLLVPLFHTAFYASARDIFGEWSEA